MKKIIMFFATALLASNLLADAAVRINTPLHRGYRLDWCRDWASNCGKPAADAFCKESGYAYSLNYQIANDIGNTRVIGSGAICADAYCDGFEYITCRRTSETYNTPQYRSYPLDWCRDWASNCGKPAADAYCALKGYASSYSHAIANDVGHTRLIGTGAICSDNFCDSFSYISCH